MKMYQDRTIRDMIHQGTEIYKKMYMIKNIQLIKRIGHKVISGYENTTYISATLEEIRLAKELFVNQIELGEETNVPGQLNQRDLGQCYRFYNPIMSIIEELCSEPKKQLFI